MGRLDDPRFEGKLLLLAADILTVLLLTAGSALAFLSGYRLDVDQGAVLAFCAFSAAFSTLLHSLSRPWWSIAAAAGIAAVFWLKWEDVSPVLQQIGQKMNLLPSVYMTWSSRREAALLPVFLLLCAALAWTMGWMAVRVRRWYLAALLGFILVLPAIQMGVLPSWGAMLAVFAGWGAMLLTALYGKTDPGGLARAQLLSLTGMTALILALVMALPMEGYVRPQWATDARTSLILGVRHRLERFFDMNALESGILADLGIDLSVPMEGSVQASAPGSAVEISVNTGGREDLLAAGPRRYSGRQVLSVQTDQTDGGRIYLRGGSLGTYTGDSWEMAEGEGQPFFSDESGTAAAQPALYPAQTAPEAESYTISIRDSSYRGVRFYPYRLTDGGGWTDEAGALALPEEGGWMDDFLINGAEEYRVDYVPGGPEDGFVPLAGGLAEEEGRYQAEVVYRYGYLEIPDAARQALEPLLEEVSQRDAFVDPALPERFQWPLLAASRTAAVLEELAVYDPETPAMEPGEDFAAHFLEEGRGYCIHFATAGALLLRMQGVPARYVTGYTVQLDGQGRGEALDSDAHAWVEIYLDGYGWYPVEMTPGYTGGESGISLSEEPEAEEPEQPDEPEPEPEEEKPEQALPEEEPDQADLPGEAPDGEDVPDGTASASGLRRVLAGTGAALCALGAAYALALLPRLREKTGANVNRSVICAYRRYRRVLRLGGAEDEALEELGRKAKFSQHTLSEDERETAWRCLDEAVKTARRRRKKHLRWLFSLLRPVL